MPIYLDDQLIQLSAANAGADLGTLIQVAQDLAKRDRRVVVEVQVDGQSLDPTQIAQRRGDAVGDRELRLYTADPIDLASVTLRQIASRLEMVRQAQGDAAGLFQQGQKAQGMQKVAEAMAVWQEVQQAVVQSALLCGVGLDDKILEGEPITAIISSLADQLRSLRDQIIAGDLVGLADALGYEWPATVDCWERLVAAVRGVGY